MENPCLTYLTPSLLAGDKSLVNVVAHEISHSWTGNGVTNKDWANFWVNEGFTVFLERKLSELINGEDMMMLESKVGMNELKEAINSFGKDHEYTKLSPNLVGVIFICNNNSKTLMMHFQ
jgi:leukotriene-A4 hydrolase